jgi:hypothetical protein
MSDLCYIIFLINQYNMLFILSSLLQVNTGTFQ